MGLLSRDVRPRAMPARPLGPYDTPLTPEQEYAYQAWKQRVATPPPAPFAPLKGAIDAYTGAVYGAGNDVLEGAKRWAEDYIWNAKGIVDQGRDQALGGLEQTLRDVRRPHLESGVRGHRSVSRPVEGLLRAGTGAANIPFGLMMQPFEPAIKAAAQAPDPTRLVDSLWDRKLHTMGESVAGGIADVQKGITHPIARMTGIDPNVVDQTTAYAAPFLPKAARGAKAGWNAYERVLDKAGIHHDPNRMNMFLPLDGKNKPAPVFNEKGERVDSFKEFNRLHNMGVAPAEIWARTGIEKHPVSGKTRWEISDQDARLKVNYRDIIKEAKASAAGHTEPVPLDTVFHHPELFAREPALKDYAVVFTTRSDGGGMQPFFFDHASMDRIKGAASGGYNFGGAPRRFPDGRPVRGQIVVGVGERSGHNTIEHEGQTHRDEASMMTTLLHEVQHAVRQGTAGWSEGASSSQVGVENYVKNVGEVEARLTPNRKGLDEIQRRMYYPGERPDRNPGDPQANYQHDFPYDQQVRGPNISTGLWGEKYGWNNHPANPNNPQGNLFPSEPAVAPPGAVAPRKATRAQPMGLLDEPEAYKPPATGLLGARAAKVDNKAGFRALLQGKGDTPARAELSSNFKEFTDKVTVKTLASAFDLAVERHNKMSPELQAAHVEEARKALIPYIGTTASGQLKPLMRKNAKMMKTEAGYDGEVPIKLPDGRGVETTGLSLSPAHEEQGFTTCSNFKSCKDACLGLTSGGNFFVGGGADHTKKVGPRLYGVHRTQAMTRQPEAFAIVLNDEIKQAKALAESRNSHLGIRLNVLSDVNPQVHKSLIRGHPDVTFYDYTKTNMDPIAPNHHYTYSSTGVSMPSIDGQAPINNVHSNWRAMRRRLDQGDNVAMAFGDRDHLPKSVHDEESGKDYEVIDGDTHDYRPFDLQLDPEKAGYIIGLRNKSMEGKAGTAPWGSSGFFVHHDPMIKRGPDKPRGGRGDPIRGPSPGKNKKGHAIPGETLPTNYGATIYTQPAAGPKTMTLMLKNGRPIK